MTTRMKGEWSGVKKQSHTKLFVRGSSERIISRFKATAILKTLWYERHSFLCVKKYAVHKLSIGPKKFDTKS